MIKSVPALDSAESGVTVALPALDVLHGGLVAAPQHSVSNKAPINNGSLQVGFRGRPEGFGEIGVSLDGTDMTVDIADPRPLEGPFTIKTHGEKRVGRTVLGPIAKIALVRTEEPGLWLVTPHDQTGAPLDVTPDERVVLARTLAKLADVSIGKLKRLSNAA